MFKLIKIISLSLIALYCVIFFWTYKEDSSEECQGSTCIESSVEDNLEPSEQPMSKIIYENLAADHPITMNYPETDIKIKIDKVEEVKNLLYLSGRYEKELEKATETAEAIYERAALYLNMSKVVVLNKDPQEVVFYVAPFVINSSDSEVFVYVGLFSYDTKTKQSEHLDSEFLGERIGEEKITHINDSLKIDFKGYAKGQDFSEYPEEKRVLFLQLSHDHTSLNVRKKMHKSWDKNADGINDCESENTCDDTIDYSLPRQSKEP